MHNIEQEGPTDKRSGRLGHSVDYNLIINDYNAYVSILRIQICLTYMLTTKFASDNLITQIYCISVLFLTFQFSLVFDIHFEESVLHVQ